MKKQLILIIPIIAFLIASMFSILKLRDDFSHNPDEVRGTVLWIATEVNREYWRFLDALGRYSHGDETISHEQLLLRRDIFWAQLDNYQSGNLGKHLTQASDGKEIVANVNQLLLDTETIIENLAPDDNETGQSLRAEFIVYANQINEMTQRIDKAENSYFVSVFNNTESQLLTLEWLIIAMAITGSVLIVILIVQVRNSTRLHSIADQAEKELRELNKSLEDTVLNRTQDLNDTLHRLDDAQAIANIGNFTWDLETGDVEWSDNMYRLVKYDPDSDVDINLINAQIHHPDDLPWVTEWLNDGIAKNLALLEPKQYRCICSDGEIIWIMCRARIESEDGKPIRMFGTVQDITEAKIQSELLRRTQKMDALGKLTGGISHDYNNVLGVIIGYIDLLSNELVDNEKLSGYVNEVKHAATRASKLSKKLLSFSRKKPAEVADLSINDLLKNIQLMLEKTLTARIEVNYLLADGLDHILIDANDLEDAILNISINSMHAMAGTGKLTYETKNVMLSDIDAQHIGIKPGSYVTLSISDTGCGMDAETKERMFEPFFSTKEELGTGLGLSQVYGLVQRSKGGIKVYSEPDHGTRITLYFPITETPVDMPTYGNGTEEENYDGTETILVVDDEVPLLELAEAVIIPFGYRVITTQSAIDALEILKTEHIDLIISDIIMPKMDGYEFAVNVRQTYPDIKLIFASGFNDVEGISEIDEMLLANMIQKPFSSDELMRKIRLTLDN